MATKKGHSLDDKTYRELKQTVQDLEDRYIRIVNLYYTEKKLFEGNKRNMTAWKQLCLSEIPQGMELDLWYRLVAAHKKRRPRSQKENLERMVSDVLIDSGVVTHVKNTPVLFADERDDKNQEPPDWPMGAW